MAEDLGLWLEASSRLSWLGWIAMALGDYQQARDLAEQALRLATGQGYRAGEVFAETVLGYAARRDGKLDLAEAHLRTLLARAEGGEQPLYLPMVLCELGFVAELRGDAQAAIALHTEALAAARQLGAPRDTAVAMEGLAGALALTGRHAPAARLLDEAATVRRDASLPPAPVERDDLDRATAATRALTNVMDG
jgi:tetratricopeptide (TPR) repeat protein